MTKWREKASVYIVPIRVLAMIENRESTDQKGDTRLHKECNILCKVRPIGAGGKVMIHLLYITVPCDAEHF